MMILLVMLGGLCACVDWECRYTWRAQREILTAAHATVYTWEELTLKDRRANA